MSTGTLKASGLAKLLSPTARPLLPCNAPGPLRQVSSSYSLRCLVFCLRVMHSISCHHMHCIIMFSKLASVRVPQFSPLSILSPGTLARGRDTSEIVFYKWPENVLGMGRKLACGVVMLSIGLLPSFIAFGVRLMPQRITIATI